MENMESERYKAFEDIVSSFCIRITNALNSPSNIMTLNSSDDDIVEKIIKFQNDYGISIDQLSLTEKDRTEIEILLADECNRYVNNIVKKRLSFEIGAGIELVEQYCQLMRSVLGESMPHVLINIEKLLKLRLATIDLTSNYNQVQEYDKTISNDVAELKKTVQDLKDQSQKISDDVENVKDSRGEIYKDIITMITIFSAIILAMAGVFSFSSVAFEHMISTNFYRFVFVVCILGCFIVAIFGGLFYFIYNVRHDIKSLSDKETVEKLRINSVIALVPMIATIIVFGSLIVFLLRSKLDELEDKTTNTSTVTQMQTTPTTSVETDPNVETNAQSLEFIIPAALPEVKESEEQD